MSTGCILETRVFSSQAAACLLSVACRMPAIIISGSCTLCYY